MSVEKISKYVKAVAAAAACFGVAITPEHTDKIIAGIGAVAAILYGVEGTRK